MGLSLVGSFSSREEPFTGLEVRLVVGSWVSVGEWSHFGCKNPSSENVQDPSALHIGADSLRDTHRGSSGMVTWSFSQVMMGAGSPSVWHSKRAVPFSSTVWDLGCREKSASAGDEHSEERVREPFLSAQPRRTRSHGNTAEQTQNKGDTVWRAEWWPRAKK